MPDPLTLAFDTSGPWVAAALLRGSEVLAARSEAMDRGQSERLIPLLQELAGDLRRLQLVACGTGPGNFTGVRIAVAAARALALALKIPAVGVTRFEAAVLGYPLPALVVIDGPRGERLLQRFDEARRGPWLAAADEALPTAGCATIIGDPGTRGRITGNVTPLPAPDLLAINIGRIAAQAPGPHPRPAPLYLRGPDAALPRDPPPRILA